MELKPAALVTKPPGRYVIPSLFNSLISATVNVLEPARISVVTLVYRFRTVLAAETVKAPSFPAWAKTGATLIQIKIIGKNCKIRFRIVLFFIMSILN